MQSNAVLTGENEIPSNDLGPLAWVLDELRKSLDGATKALRRFVRDAELARGSDLAALDASQLRIARQQLHQAVGALEMVGMVAPAKVLRAMEALAQKFVQRPEFCSNDAAHKVETASFALAEYLEGVLKGKQASSVALFPQYRDILELLGDDRIHPADLWLYDWRWIDIVLPTNAAPLAYDSAVRARIDGLVLKVVKSGDASSAKMMRDISLGFAAAQTTLEPRVFWKISAAYFEAVYLTLCPADVYGKRAASRILLQYRTVARGEPGISERLVQDLLFFCAQAVPQKLTDAPVLVAVRAAYGLTRTKPIDYETPQFGRFDPALLVQARKRIAAATETWSALAGGDTNRLKIAADQFSLVSDSVLKLHPESGDLAHALTRSIEVVTRSGEAPAPALAMEVATAVLYLEAAYEDMDPTDSHMAERSSSLARRIELVNTGGKPEPLEGWMEDLYRRVSDRQTMGSVVVELRTTLGNVEKSLDAFFRDPSSKLPLHEVPIQLAQMRGVFSVLGLDQAAMASRRMRESVEKFLVDEVDIESARTGIFEKLGNSLGALGFLIDMLSYQRELAKKLFVYDEQLGEFKPLMGREKTVEHETVVEPVVELPVPTPAPAPAPTPVPAPTPAPAPVEVVRKPAPVVNTPAVPPPQPPAPVVAPPVPLAPAPVVAAPIVPIQAPAKQVVAEVLDDDERELRDIFLDEAREVIQTGQGAINDLLAHPTDLGQQTTLRRSFHTLKGSARMVALNEFGEAGWSMEQLLNAWLADQKPASKELLSLSDRAMHGFARWVEDIANGTDAHWSASEFRKAADSLRLHNKLIDLRLPGEDAPSPVAVAPQAPPAEDAPNLELDDSFKVEFSATQILPAEPEVASPKAAPAPLALPTAVAEDFPEFDFDDLLVVSADDALAEVKEVAPPAEQHLEPVLAFDATQTFDFSPAATTAPVAPLVEEVVELDVADLLVVTDEDLSPEQPEEDVFADFELVQPPALALDAAQAVAQPALEELELELEPALPAPVVEEIVEIDFDDLDWGDAPVAAEVAAVPEPEPETPENSLSLDEEWDLLLKQADALPAEVASKPELELSFEEEALSSAEAQVDAEVNALLEAELDSKDAAAQVVAAADEVELAELDLADEALDLDEQFAEQNLVVPPQPIDDQIKRIGDLRIGAPLYNVYLSEADVWSQRLQTELAEWALELKQPVSDTAVVLAHSLAGSSATVGFMGLSDMSRALEHALLHVQLHKQKNPEHAQIFNDAAEDIRRLLHQFAAGFLKKPNQDLLDALRVLLETEFVAATADEQDSLYQEYFEDSWPEDESFEELELEHDQTEIKAEAQQPQAIAQAVVEVEPVPPVVAPPTVDEAPEPVAAEAPPQPVPQALVELPELLDFDEPVEVAPAPEVAEVAKVAQAPEEALPVPVTVAPAMAIPAQPSPVQSVPQVTHAADDDIDERDVLDVDLFPIFEEEALELLPKLGAALRQWSDEPDELSARKEVLRVLHTLKGSARLAGAMRLGEMTHRMESAIEELGMESLQVVQLEPLLTQFDAIQSGFDQLRVVPEQTLHLPEVAPVLAPTSAAPGAAEAANNAPSLNMLTALAAPIAAPSMPARPVANQTVRVRSQLLDRLVNQAGEVMITRSRLDARLSQLRGSLGELTGNLDRLRNQLHDIELQSESQMQSRLAQTKDSIQGFDPLEFDRFTRVQELTRMMAESVHDVATVQRNLQRAVEGAEDDLIAQARQARELQRDLLRTRMVEFEGVSERLYGVVRQASKDAGKQVKLEIKGGSLDMDRGVLDRITPALEHLLRNSVAHGIEDPALRVSLGKPAAGTISIELQQQSNDVTLNFNDDGAGLNMERILQKARANGLISEDEVLTEAEAANLIFASGFSTAAKVSEIAGRGVGLDVVRSEVNALGGRIETTSQHGRGTQFRLVLPLTTAVTQVVMLRMGEMMVGVPANLVEMVRRVSAADLSQAYQTNVYEFGGEQVPFFWSGALLQASTQSAEMVGKTLPVAIFRSAGLRVAMHIDEVLGNQEVVVKNLGPQLSRLPGLAGVSVLASGSVVLIYNPVALMSVYGTKVREAALSRLSPSAATTASDTAALVTRVRQVPLVLVVDDSITVRRVTQRLLKREGFRVSLAADGLQALERLQEEKPSVVLSDIEMPRMDGFDLARNIRGDAAMCDLPIIMITSRIAEKHREYARELGVDHYLGKPYSEDELIGLVRQYCATLVEV